MINKIRSSRQPPIKKPKPKGKSAKQKKIKSAAAKKFDVFETFLESDAGSGSSKQGSSYFVEEIEKLRP
jgi:mannitol-specific phosphotransferase system IIBC component